MGNVALFGDSIEGMTTGEHNGHTDSFGSPLHDPCPITGRIVSGSSNVFCKGKPVAYLNSQTEEYDCCCPGSMSGSVVASSSKVFVNGRPIARLNDNVRTHNGTGRISAASSHMNHN